MSQLRKMTGVSLRDRMVVLLRELRVAIVCAETTDARMDIAHRIDFEIAELRDETSEAKT